MTFTATCSVMVSGLINTLHGHWLRPSQGPSIVSTRICKRFHIHQPRCGRLLNQRSDLSDQMVVLKYQWD
jgi:hypothetical protein